MSIFISNNVATNNNSWLLFVEGADDFSEFVTFDNGIVDSKELADQGIVTIIKGPLVSLSDEDSLAGEGSSAQRKFLVTLNPHKNIRHIGSV